MDARRLDALLRSLNIADSRRGALSMLLGGLSAAYGLTEAKAGKKGTKKRRRKKRRRRNEPSQPPPPPPFCAGKNTCGDVSSTCQSSGVQCNCLVNAETGESLCLDFTSSRFAAICDECTPEETCVDLRFGTGPCTGTSFFCFTPCPNPL